MRNHHSSDQCSPNGHVNLSLFQHDNPIVIGVVNDGTMAYNHGK